MSVLFPFELPFGCRDHFVLNGSQLANTKLLTTERTGPASKLRHQLWEPRSQAITCGCTATMTRLPIQALKFLQGPAQTLPSPGHFPQMKVYQNKVKRGLEVYLNDRALALECVRPGVQSPIPQNIYLKYPT